jgi:hypothetical protein
MTCDNDDIRTEKWRQFMLATLRTLKFFTWDKCGGFVDSMTCDNDDTRTEKWRRFILATLRTLNRFNSVKKNKFTQC